MKIFDCYIEDNEGIMYAYDSVTALIVKITDGKYVAEKFLPAYLKGCKFQNIISNNEYIVLFGIERFSVVFHKKKKHIEVLDFSDLQADTNGWRVSNIIECGDGIIFVPRILTCIKKYYYSDFEYDLCIEYVSDYIKFNKKGLNDCFVRSWGAYIDNNNLFAIISGEKKDFILLMGLDGGFMDCIDLPFDRLFHLEKIEDVYIAQAVKDNNMYLVRFNLTDGVISQIMLDTQYKDFHSQFVLDNYIVVLETDRMYIIDKKLQEYRCIDSDKCFLQENYFYDLNKIMVYDEYDDRFKTVVRLYENALYKNKEYIDRMKEYNSGINDSVIVESSCYDLIEYIHSF